MTGNTGSVVRGDGALVLPEGAPQRKFLKIAGVHAMQGYLFAKPEPIAALRARLGLDVAEAKSA